MRVTIDLDSWWFQDLQKTILKAEPVLGFPDRIRKSPSGKGYHIIWYMVNVSKIELIYLRLLLGDDIRRIRFDVTRPSKPNQVLFKKKKKVVIKVK